MQICFNYLFIHLFFGCERSSLLCRLFSSFHELGLLSNCSAGASHCTGCSCWGAQTLEHTTFSSCWAFSSCTPGLQSTGSIVVAYGLNCCRACGIFPDKELNPCLLHWQGDFSPLSQQGGPSSADFQITGKDMLLYDQRNWKRESQGPFFIPSHILSPSQSQDWLHKDKIKQCSG